MPNILLTELHSPETRQALAESGLGEQPLKVMPEGLEGIKQVLTPIEASL